MAVIALAMVLVLASTGPLLAQEAEAFDSCAARPLADCAFSDCLVDVAWEKGLFDEGRKRLQQALSEEGENACLLFNLASLLFSSDREEAVRLQARAAEAFQEQGLSYREGLSRLHLVDLYGLLGRSAQTLEELGKAKAAAELSGDAHLMAQVGIREGASLLDQGKDLVFVLHKLREIRGDFCPDGRYDICADATHFLANALFTLGRYFEAAALYRELFERARIEGDRFRESMARSNLANTKLKRWPGGERGELVEELEQALESTLEMRQWSAAADRLRLLGKLHAGEEGRRYLERCVMLARDHGARRELANCLQALAAQLAEKEPRQARKLAEQSRALALETQDPWALAFGAQDLMRVFYQTRKRPEAFQRSIAILDEIEKLRELQSDSASRAAFFSSRLHVYYWLSGFLLDSAGDSPRAAHLERAFQVTERLRARVLLDALQAADSAPRLLPTDPLYRERVEVTRRIVRAQRRLLDPELTPEERALAMGRLEEAEKSEADLLGALAEEHPEYLRLTEPRFVTLAEIRSELKDHEALLSFQLAPWEDLGEFAGGSWLLVVTRNKTRRYRLPDLERIEENVLLFLGLMGRRESSKAIPATALYEDLLQDALRDLPDQVERLILVPDAALHLLSFGTLRASPEGPFLAEKYRLSAAPSATLWWQWRQGPALGSDLDSALIFADPALVQAAAREEDAAGSPAFRFGFSPPALQYARSEARAVARHLGRRTQILSGSDAREETLKRPQELRRFRILHLATHALIDVENPGRSAILLTAGTDREDGLLQYRDIVALDLEGKLVVLSACQSISGTVLRGEGVLGLGRAFFQAGARAVVGGLWPLRDDEASRLIDSFYRYLSRGVSVDEALRQAQRERIRAGDPIEAWAGLTVLGDGAFVPFPEARAARFPSGWIALCTALLGGGLFWAIRWNRPS